MLLENLPTCWGVCRLVAFCQHRHRRYSYLLAAVVFVFVVVAVGCRDSGEVVMLLPVARESWRALVVALVLEVVVVLKS